MHGCVKKKGGVEDYEGERGGEERGNTEATEITGYSIVAIKVTITNYCSYLTFFMLLSQHLTLSRCKKCVKCVEYPSRNVRD